MSTTVGLIFDSSIHYLDHIGPFCALLGCPLILIDPIVQEKARQYYPDLAVIEADMDHIQKTLSSFTHVISCSPRSLFNMALGPLPCTTLWLPHGNSDKGQIISYFDALQNDTTALIYGQKMAEVLSTNCPFLKLICVGHYRALYYQKHRAFYQQKIPIHFSKKQPTVLYAPTWEDSENNCSFWKAFPLIAKNLPQTINLIVKLHPNTVTANAPKIEQLIGRYESDQLQFLLDYPPIFPILDQTDFYLGDRSSIGYDFLFFDRPLFFLDPHEHPKGRDLTLTGKMTQPEHFYRDLFDENPARFSKERKSMYRYTFDIRKYNVLKKAIDAIIRRSSLR